MILSRRLATVLLGASPALAWADEPAVPAPQVTTPPAPPVLTLPTPVVPAIRLPAPSTQPIDKTKIYYLFFDQAIDVASMRALRRQLTTLVEAGVAQVNLVLSSPGGLLEPTLITYGFIRALPAIINTHAQGFVQSAATILFLAGQERSADRSARFLFHPSQTMLSGSLNEQQIHDRLSQIGSVSEVVASIYKDRTALTDAEIARFASSEVIYTPDQAQAMGVIQLVEDLKLPGGQTARVMFLD